SIKDMYKVGDKGLRWFVMCDDDTIFMVENLVEPIFSSMDRYQALNHLIKETQIDLSHLLQQAIATKEKAASLSPCRRATYYENIISRSLIQKPPKTFRPWAKNARPPFFMFNTRWVTDNTCKALPIWDQLLTTYILSLPLPSNNPFSFKKSFS
ncbi:hypothetical protein Tsubulata_012188, partial [Turnera subulata]